MEIPTKFVEKAKFVATIFSDVEREYDALLGIMTLGLDWTWRSRMLSKIQYQQTRCVLDLACGTGLVTFALSRSMGSQGLVIGLDPSMSMLRIALRRRRATRTCCSLEFVRAVGEFMPFRDGIFDYETTGLALRNFADKSAMFEEARRTLANSGWFLSVDFVVPNKSLVRKLYMFHIFNVLPTLGGLVSSSWHRTLVYLANSIQLSASPAEVRELLSRHGFQRTFSEKMTLGVVALVGGQR